MAHHRGYWTLEKCIESAAQYVSRTDFQQLDRGAYKAAYKNNWVGECCAHMKQRKKNGYWTKQRCIDDAAMHIARSEWCHASPSAYKAARNNCWIDECCEHMERKDGRDNDAVYIWQAIGEYFNGNPVYKVGVTSARLGDTRIGHCAQEGGFNCDIIILARVTEKATELEALILSLGSSPRYVGFNGSTEFRAMDSSQLAEAIELITHYRSESK